MAIDHGLEGRNSEKSRQRRESKSRRLKKMVQKSLKAGDAGGRRGEVKFDEVARQAWLGGFQNRKQERRKYGLTMQVLKDQKLRKEAKKAKVLTLSNLHKEDEKGLALRTLKQKRRSLKFGTDEEEENIVKKSKTGSDEGGDEDEDDEDEEDSEDEKETENIFNDDATVNMFGAEVSVVIDENPIQTGHFQTNEELFSNQPGDDDSGDEQSIQSLKSRVSMAHSNRELHQPTRFDRAMKKVKATLGKKKKNKKQEMKGKARSLRKTVESKMLFEKATGRKLKRNKNHKK